MTETVTAYASLSGPEVTQTMKMLGNPDDVKSIILDPLDASSKSFILLAINDNASTKAGGSHWSLCVFSKPENALLHFDSSLGSNHTAFKNISRILKNSIASSDTELIEIKDCLQQGDSYSCGDFTLCHTDLVCMTIAKDQPLRSIKKLHPKKTHVKRSEIIQIVDNMKEA